MLALARLPGLLRWVRGDAHVPVYRHRGLDGVAAASGGGRLRPGAGRPPGADPRGPGRARRPGGGHPGGRVLRRVLLADRLRGRGDRDAARPGGPGLAPAASTSGSGWACTPVRPPRRPLAPWWAWMCTAP